jgi:hypothetical protein
MISVLSQELTEAQNYQKLLLSLLPSRTNSEVSDQDLIDYVLDLQDKVLGKPR